MAKHGFTKKLPMLLVVRVRLGQSVWLLVRTHYCGALSPGDWVQWQINRLRRWVSNEKGSARFGMTSLIKFLNYIELLNYGNKTMETLSHSVYIRR